MSWFKLHQTNQWINSATVNNIETNQITVSPDTFGVYVNGTTIRLDGVWSTEAEAVDVIQKMVSTVDPTDL